MRSTIFTYCLLLLFNTLKAQSVFYKIDTIKLPTAVINCLAFDGSKLWIGTDKSLYIIENYTVFSIFDSLKMFQSQKIYSIHIDINSAGKTIWLGDYEGGLIRLSENNKTENKCTYDTASIKLNDAFQNKRVITSIFGKNNLIYARCRSDSLYTVSKANNSIQPNKHTVFFNEPDYISWKNKKIFSTLIKITYNFDNTYWVIGKDNYLENKIAHIYKKNKIDYYSLTCCRNVYVNDFAISKNGNIYIASDNGLYLFNPNKNACTLMTPEKFNCSSIAIQEDNGIIWAGSEGMGLLKLTPDIPCGKPIAIEPIKFKPSSAEYQNESEAQETLRKVVDFLNFMPETNVEIIGYTAVATPMPYDIGRAKKVKSTLIELGIDEKRVTAIGEGMIKHIADSTNKEGMRVDVIIICKDDK